MIPCLSRRREFRACVVSDEEKAAEDCRTPKRYRANWGSGSRASVMECAQSPGAVWKGWQK
jgi:hypothetical protein